MNRRGLYAIADTATLGGRDLVAAVESAMAGGAVLVQYRDKSGDHNRRRREAGALVDLGHHHGVPIIINDDIGLARACGAAGVHVGSDDSSPAAAREQLGADAIIGVSCYDRLERARDAARAGADYVAFGRMHASPTKPGGPHADAGILGAAKAATGLTVCAIGGITLARAPALIDAGADLLAVIGDLFADDAVQARAAAYARMFNERDPALPSSPEA